MGGLAGHMSHLYENPRLTFSEIKSVLKKASEGKLEGTEKTDGQNLYISFSVPNQELRTARNKTNIKTGGMNARQLTNKFSFSDELKKSFSQAFRDFEDVIKQFPKEKQIEIFGPDTNIYYNAEIINPETANVINYDTKIVSVHRGGGAEFDKETGSPKTVSIEDPETGEMITGPKDISKNAELLATELEKVQQDLAGGRFKIEMDAIQNLKKLEDETVLNQAMDRLESEISSEGISDNQMIIEYVMARLLTLMREEDLELDEETEKLILKRILLANPTFRSAYGYDKIPAEINKRALKKAGDSGDKNKIIYIINNSDDFLKKAIAPIESIIHDFSVEMLKNLESIFILDNKKETERLRGELEKAIKVIEGSGSEAAMEILSKQMDKIKSVENVSTAAEGFVFDHDGHTYKFTGNFAPVNQILGLFKYGRGDVPALERITEEEKEEEKKSGAKSVAIMPGSFKPPHLGHLGMAKDLAKKADEVLIIVSKPGPKSKRLLPFSGVEISYEKAIELWKLLLKEGFENIKLVESSKPSPSPASALSALMRPKEERKYYEDFEFNPEEYDKFYFGISEKEDKSDPRFDMYSENDKVEVIVTPVIKHTSAYRKILSQMKSDPNMRDHLRQLTMDSEESALEFAKKRIGKKKLASLSTDPTLEEIIPLLPKKTQSTVDKILKTNLDGLDPENYSSTDLRLLLDIKKERELPVEKLIEEFVGNNVEEYFQIVYGTDVINEEIFNMLKKKMSPEKVEKQDDISVTIMEMVEEMYLETIRKVGEEWALYPKGGGERLGTHSSKKKAREQEIAIKASEASKQKNESEEKIDEISAMGGGAVAGYSSPFPGIRIRMKQKEKKDTNYTKNNKRFPYEQ